MCKAPERPPTFKLAAKKVGKERINFYLVIINEK